MQNEKLQATLSELEQQVRALGSVDEESRQSLLNAAQEIRVALNEADYSTARSQTMLENLTSSVEKFEVTHPTLTSVLGRLVDILGQMGI
jgi:hypothetical protein